MSDLIGIWCLESSENINAYFKQLGNLYKKHEVNQYVIIICI